jgi:FMN phosphatase YigB (HAD superfamily)
MTAAAYDLLRALTHWAPVVIAVEAPPPLPGAIADLTAVLDHLPGIEIVSIDIFDTLLRRDVDPPDAPKREAMQLLSMVLARLGQEVSVARLLALRDAAEAEARQAAMGGGDDPECTLSEIFEALYARVRVEFGVDPAAILPAAGLVTHEVEAEIAHLLPMPGAVDLLAGLRARGIPVVLISDMYLEPGHLQAMLDHAGLAGLYDRIHVSSAERLSKGSGKLFDRLIADGVLRPGVTLHVGDHPVSDVERPMQRGLRALRFYDPAEIERRARLRAAQAVAGRWGDLGPAWQAIGAAERLRDAPAAFATGYRGLGPAFTLFAFDVLHRALAGGYERLFFLARDGYIFRDLYRRLAEGLRLGRALPLPAVGYIHLSRAASRFAALEDFGADLVSLASRVNQHEGVWSLLATLGLERAEYAAEVEAILARRDAADDLAGTGAEIAALLDDSGFRTRLEAAQRTVRDRLRRYLRQAGLIGGGPALLVDIGWNGSILRAVERAFGAEPDFPPLDALFFGRLHGVETERIRIAPGFAFDERRSHPIEALINESRELFESAASSMEGTARGYAEDPDGSITIRHGRNLLSAEDRATVGALQAGILAWCDDFITAWNRFSPDVAALRPAAVIEAARLIAGHTPADRAVLAALRIDLGWGTEARVSLGAYLGLGGADPAPPPHVPGALRIALEPSGGGPNDRQKLFERLHGLLRALEAGRGVIVYGVGTVAAILAPALAGRILFFVDGNAGLHGQTFLGKPIRPVEAVMDHPEATVLVTPINRRLVIERCLQGFAGTVLWVDDHL